MKASVPACDVIETDLKSRPQFLDADNEITLVYMGTMTENAQLVAMDHLEPYRNEVREAIARGQRFFFTGNAFEILAKEIVDLDDMPYDADHPRVDKQSKTTRCLQLFDITVTRQMMHRFNSLYLGTYDDVEVVGFKSIFTHAKCNYAYEPLFRTVKGPGIDNTLTGEGIRYKNFMATYLTGPLMVLNPPFLQRFLTELGETEIALPHLDAAMEAYDQRLREFKREGLNYNY